MSRLSKEVKIAGKDVTISELSVRDIKQLWRDMTGAAEQPADDDLMLTNEKVLKKYWDKCISGIKLEDADDLAPSELKVIYDAWSEVNAIFLELAKQLEGENPLLKKLREVIVNDLMLRFAALLKEDIPTSGITDTASS